MGLSIHYRGRLKNPDLIAPLSDELVDIAQSLGWETESEILLRKKMKFLDDKINAVSKILSETDIELDPDAEPHEIADKLERLLREKLEEL